MKTFTSTILSLTVLLFLMSTSAFTQGTTTISGTVKDNKANETLAGVNIIVKGKVIGTITDVDGNFNLTVKSPPPLTIQASFIGFSTAEFEITEAVTTGLDIVLEEAAFLGQEVVVSASRVEESILKSPVSIEKMGILDIQNTAADDYYKGLAYLKGVDVTTSSINFQIINARGFNSTSNTRFVQLVDGMDTQAPALNFPIGNLNGPSKLDIESIEMIPGASSALYGPNAFNGVLLINSKSAFEYQGLSIYLKPGVNHIGTNADQEASMMIDASIRYAKAFKNKIAFKLNLSYKRANDWEATSDFDRNTSSTPEGFDFNPGADKIHFHGDEASINLGIFPFSTNFATLARTNPVAAGSLENYLGDLPSHVVSITPYNEVDLINYNAENFKANAGLYYRPTDKLELSYLYNGGFGTSIYTGSQRYSLTNFGIQQHRIQLKGDNFHVRAFSTKETSGDSYITEFLALKTNERAIYTGLNSYFNLSSSERVAQYGTNIPFLGGAAASAAEQTVTPYLTTYALAYMNHLATTAGLAPGEIGTLSTDQRKQIEIAAHNNARNFTDQLFHLDPNSAEFKQAKADALTGTVPNGPLFADKSGMYQIEGQYDFKNDIDFIDLQAGASFRMFDLRSEGTIFPDKDGGIQIKEYGAYMQAAKKLNDNIKLSGSLRYDKNENFKGQFNPRISSVFTFLENHNIRASYQTGFRNPTTQGQYIDLDIISKRLLGGLQENYDAYRLTRKSITDIPLVFTHSSVANFRNQAFADGSVTAVAVGNLKPFTKSSPVQSEKVNSIEVGYKSVIANKLMVDAVYYYNVYNDFITQIQLVVATEFTEDPTLVERNDPYGYSLTTDPSIVGDPNYGTILNGTANNTFQIFTNIDNQVTSQGAAVGLTYSLPKYYTLSGNYNWNVLNEDLSAQGFLNDFNTPEHKVNLSFSNRKVTENFGFNVSWRWQDAFRWESSFVLGDVDAFSTLDAQVSYKLSSINSMIKLGGSNLMNKKYVMSLGGPNIGAIYYLSITFDQFMN